MSHAPKHLILQSQNGKMIFCSCLVIADQGGQKNRNGKNDYGSFMPRFLVMVSHSLTLNQYQNSLYFSSISRIYFGIRSQF